MIRKYLIADMIIEVDFEGDAVFEDRLASYISTKDNLPDVKVIVKRTSNPIFVKKENIVKLSDITYFYSSDSEDVLFYHDPAISKVIAKISFSKDCRQADITLYELKAQHGVEDNMLMFNVMSTLMSYASQMHSSFVFHSSSICHNGEGIAFSAKSGTGKSTHTKLWIDNFPGTFILNDDTPLITQGKDNEFYLSGTPWAGTTGINRNVTVPLKALVFLERDKENSITRISPPEAMPLFFSGIKTPLTDRMLSNCLDTLNKLFISVPIYKLRCNMNPEAAIVAHKAIFGDK